MGWHLELAQLSLMLLPTFASWGRLAAGRLSGFLLLSAADRGPVDLLDSTTANPKSTACAIIGFTLRASQSLVIRLFFPPKDALLSFSYGPGDHGTPWDTSE